MILYEYPFNERIRTYLRLEHLFLRLATLVSREAPLDHHFALTTIFEVMDLKNVQHRYTGGKLGWKGDVTSNFIATETLAAWGWKPPRSSREAVLEAARRLASEKSRA